MSKSNAAARTGRRSISRRSFMKATAAIGMGAAAWPLAAGAVRAATPKRGGVLRIAVGHGNSTDSYDPAQFIGGFMQCFSFARYNCLTEIAPDGSLRPELAESWEPSADARTWIFHIRKGVEFQNGKPLTASDVVASINHHRGPESQSAMKPVVDQISEIREDGSSRVVVTLVNGSADFPYTLADYHMVICPSVDGKLDWQSGIGTGGYQVQEFEPGVRAALTRNPNYWKPDAAYFDGVELSAITDSTARTAALLGGQVDVMDRVPFNTAAMLQAQQGVQIEEVLGSQHYTFAMDTRAAPFADNNVRLALKYAVNRQELVNTVLAGHGRVGNDQPIGPAYRYYAADLEQREYDPEKARYHLKQAGLDRLEISLSASDAAFAGAVDAAVLYREHASKAGIDITVVREPADGYWSDVWMKKPFSAVFWRGRPTEDWFFSTVYATGAPWNDTFWDHPRFNEVLAAARVELDESRRATMYAELQQLVRDEGGAIIPMFANYVSASSSKVRHHEQVAASDDLDGMRLTERWWFD